MINIPGMRRRFARFLSERYQQREQPSCLADLFLWTLIVIVAAWPLPAVFHALAILP